MAAWPRWVDPSVPGARPFSGWPVEVEQLDNGLHDAAWELETIETGGFPHPVLQVLESDSGDLVYALRMRGTKFKPLVRRPGTYKVVVSDPDGDFYKEWLKVVARRRTQSLTGAGSSGNTST